MMPTANCDAARCSATATAYPGSWSGGNVGNPVRSTGQVNVTGSGYRDGVFTRGLDNPDIYGIVIPMTTAHADHIVIIPCAAAKVDHTAPARDLYDSANFRSTLRAATITAADIAAEFGVTTKVMILSAEHGLLDLDTEVAPYDTKMGNAGCIGTDALVDQLVALAPSAITSMLPGSYYRPVWAAVSFINEEGSDEDPWIDLMDTYEAAPGIGYQRGVASALVRIAA